MSFSKTAVFVLASALAILSLGDGAHAACRTSGSFEAWRSAFRQHAAREGVSEGTLRRALDTASYSERVVARDRRQGFFAQSFLAFKKKLATPNRVKSGRRKLQQHASIFAAVDKKYGVPATVITAFWALESDFGAGMGKDRVLDALATLAYDCRRSDLFRRELLAALKIIDRGDLQPQDMIGSWAGELGQTQFLPTHYLNHAVDFDGDGRRDLFRSPADIIASTAAYMRHIGWKRGEPWLEEVHVPPNLKWQEADLEISHPRSVWAAWGVRKAGGGGLASDSLKASLLLPMGRHGPAFLAYDNFKTVYLEWNNSLNYATTAAYLATRIAGAGPMREGSEALEAIDGKTMQRLQRALVRRGHDVGKIDGVIGAKTRAAVKKEQLRLGLPPDSYPTVELLSRLGG
ncbi:MAG: hypothetical protein RLZ98_547 [Pseudomonadota bacterium]